MALGAAAIRRDPGNLPDLLEALEDPNGIVRYWGALGCSMLGTDAASATRVLEAHMADPDEDRWVQVQCADALARAGPVDTAVAFLIDVAGNAGEPFPTRLQAVRSLALVGPRAAASIDSLTAAASDPNEYVSHAAQHAVEVVSGSYTPGP
jgi:HEAT repeat protein